VVTVVVATVVFAVAVRCKLDVGYNADWLMYPDDGGVRVLLTTEIITRNGGADYLARQFAALRSATYGPATVVRLFVQWRDVLRDDGDGHIALVNTTALANTLQVLEMAAHVGLKVIVTGMQQRYREEQPRWLRGATDDIVIEHGIAFWHALSAAIAGRSSSSIARHIAAFDLQNEPNFRWTPPSSLLQCERVVGCLPPLNFTLPTRGTRRALCYDSVHNCNTQKSWTTWVHRRYGSAMAVPWPDWRSMSNDTWQSPLVPPEPRLLSTKPLTYRQRDYRDHLTDLRRQWALKLRHVAVNAWTATSSLPPPPITIGVLFAGENVHAYDGGVLDSYAVHLYPRGNGAPQRFFEMQLRSLPDDGRPVLIEECFPLNLAPNVTLTQLLDAYVRAAAVRNTTALVSQYFGDDVALLLEPVRSTYEKWNAVLAAYAASA